MTCVGAPNATTPEPKSSSLPSGTGLDLVESGLVKYHTTTAPTANPPNMSGKSSFTTIGLIMWLV